MWTCIAQDAEMEREKLPYAGLIHFDCHGYFLMSYDGKMEFIGDTWHLNVEDAFEQARSQYGVHPDAWREHVHIEDQRDAIEFLRDLLSR
jgi:hypothetical protein